MMGWLLANGFFLALILIGAGCYSILGSLVDAMHLTRDVEMWAYLVAAILSLVGCGCFSRKLYYFIDRRVNK